MNRQSPLLGIISVRTLQASLVAMLLHGVFHWPLTGPTAIGLFLTPLLCLYFVFVFVAPWTWSLPIATRLPTTEKTIALTFDDGPSPETTPFILDILRERGATATFFVLGERAERAPKLIARIVAEGHALGLHGYSHQPLVLCSRRKFQAELNHAAHSLPAQSFPFRPPHGFKNLPMAYWAKQMGMTLCAWSLNPRDYKTDDPERIAQTLLSQLHPGAIVLLHDGPANAATVKALPLILDGLAVQGYQTTSLREPL